ECDSAARKPAVMKRLDAEEVAAEQERLRARVPGREGERVGRKLADVERICAVRERFANSRGVFAARSVDDRMPWAVLHERRGFACRASQMDVRCHFAPARVRAAMR